MRVFSRGDSGGQTQGLAPKRHESCLLSHILSYTDLWQDSPLGIVIHSCRKAVDKSPEVPLLPGRVT